MAIVSVNCDNIVLNKRMTEISESLQKRKKHKQLSDHTGCKQTLRSVKLHYYYYPNFAVVACPHSLSYRFIYFQFYLLHNLAKLFCLFTASSGFTPTLFITIQTS